MAETKHANIVEAFVAAQAEFPEIAKDSTNPHFKSKYSSLDAILSATRPSLNKHGLALQNRTDFIDGHWIIVAVLTFTDGETMECPFPLSPGFISMTPQNQGSEITYKRRYTTAQLLGVTSMEDDDGNIANDGYSTQAKSAPPPPRKPAPSKPPAKKPEPTEGSAPAGYQPKHPIFDCKTSKELLALLKKYRAQKPVAENLERWLVLVEDFDKRFTELGGATEEVVKEMDPLRDAIDLAKQGAETFSPGEQK